MAGVARVAAGGQSERVGGVAAATVVSGEAEGSLHYSYTHHAAHHYMEAKFRQSFTRTTASEKRKNEARRAIRYTRRTSSRRRPEPPGA